MVVGIFGQQMPAEHGELAGHGDRCDLVTTPGADTPSVNQRAKLWPGLLLTSYQAYYNEARTHLSLDKDAPFSRTVQRVGRIVANPVLGGLHHQYVRI